MELTADDNCLDLGADQNYASESNSDVDDFDELDVVVRHPRQSSTYLLADGGDGAEADLLGTTPPRSRIRTKERNRKTKTGSDLFLQKGLRIKRNDALLKPKIDVCPITDRLKKRASVMHRSRERDSKQGMSPSEHRTELPWPFPGAMRMPAVPTLVESCNRFMCLTSRLKARESAGPERPPDEPEERPTPDEELPESRVNFHKTFSMLINMGNNVEKGCRRTISREEQVWQNELKDLIWLELQAKVAGRTLAQQDAHLCAQRNAVPAVLTRIMNYRFVNSGRCESLSIRKSAGEGGSREDLATEAGRGEDVRDNDSETTQPGCLSFDCRHCTDAIGKAMREISSLLDSFYNAVELYPSSKAMTAEHPLIATHVFKNRLKAMCVWYNTALHMRLKILAVRRMMRSLRLKAQRSTRVSQDSSISRQSSSADSRQCLVRFNVGDNPTDSSNSDASTHSDNSNSKEPRYDVKDSGEDTAKSSDGETGNSGEVREAYAKTDDEVDSGISHGETGDRNGPPTPEIVISESKYGTSDTSTSNESSGPGPSGLLCGDVYELGSLGDITRLHLLGRCSVSPYRYYHHEMLKTQGVRRCMMFINKLRKNVLHKVHITLEKPDSPQSESFQEEETVRVFEDTKDEEKTEPPRDEELEKTYELRRYGCWSAECLAMRLPSYRSHFLVLSSIGMEAVHDYLSLRLEARPDRPSCLTVKQLIHELKEGLDISTEMRYNFVGNVAVALEGGAVTPAAKRDLLMVLRTYDATVECVLKQYLSYLSTMSETEHMARAWLQAEWAFTARLAPRLHAAALTAPLTFTDISCNQISRLQTEFKNKFDYLVELEKSAQHTPNRYTAYVMCRAVQDIYARWREPLLQAAQWARALAARLARAHPPTFQPQRAAIFNKLMSMRELTLKHTEIVLERTSVPDEELELTEGLVTRIRELLLQMFKLGFELHKELYKLVNSPKPEERIQRRIRPASLQPIRPQQFQEARRRRPETMIINETVNHMIHKELHRVVNDVSARMVGHRRSLANSPPKVLRSKFFRSDSIVEDAVFDDKLFENYGENHNESSIERLLADEEAEQEAVQLRGGSVSEASASSEEREWAALVARAVIEFARCWMRFVVERCDRGRGLRPRWASQGLEFLMLACDPCNTKHLSEEEFEELKTLMDGCISHVVGSRPRADPSLAPRHRHRLQSPAPSSPNTSPNLATSPSSAEIEPPTYNVLDDTAHKKRVAEAVRLLEAARDEKLQEMKAVGRVLGAAVSSYEPKLKQVTFKWQRGLKIGAGTFGKVYTVVNTESGQLLAMKELSIGAGDRRALQRAANELRVLEGVIHPHLVRYYGCELHREEMLIFMELCVEGSLEALVATSGALAEHAVRRYAKQLLSAVHELHSRNIVHRDIKSGNVFLTNEGHCLKLGDFGCAVKIRANTTAPGELQGFVGTQAYMAPEVFMKSSGHGRAADVWSLGCVVTEMASGKRPFSEYDSNYQIMFVVGMGGRPEIPPTLSEEGRDFCQLCLTHDPDERPRATQLSLHHFLMLKNDDDCRCEPAYLLT